MLQTSNDRNVGRRCRTTLLEGALRPPRFLLPRVQRATPCGAFLAPFRPILYGTKKSTHRNTNFERPCLVHVVPPTGCSKASGVGPAVFRFARSLACFSVVSTYFVRSQKNRHITTSPKIISPPFIHSQNTITITIPVDHLQRLDGRRLATPCFEGAFDENCAQP